MDFALLQTANILSAFSKSNTEICLGTGIYLAIVTYSSFIWNNTFINKWFLSD